jgi:amidophosphoribosyltransferase
VFEYVYLARPDSTMDGISVYQARLNMGETLAKRVISMVPPNEIDAVIPIPNPAAPAPCSWRSCWASPTAKAL